MPVPDLFFEPVLRDLNPWWQPPHPVRPAPPPYRRRLVPSIVASLTGGSGLIHVIRGPRQVGKTTALYQVVEELLARGTDPADICLARFDLQTLREPGLLALARWHQERVRRVDAQSTPVILLLDEVHKLERWAEQVKHLHDTFAPRMVLTGSSSVLVARGQRESLAGRATTFDFPPFFFREVLEAWHPLVLAGLPEPVDAGTLFDEGFDPDAHFGAIERVADERRRGSSDLFDLLDLYFARGGYPRLHSGDVGDDRWADYLVETVFDRVLGVDIPDLFPVEQPNLLRHLYLEVARQTGREISQNTLAEACNAAGFRTSQPVVGRYLHYLADALLTREFRRYPLARRTTARVPVKITLSDLGVRNAIFRGAPSLWNSPPDDVGPLVKTLVQAVLRGNGIGVHFYRDYRRPGDRRSSLEEVDFVLEALDGRTIPVEVKFRRRVEPDDCAAVSRFRDRFPGPFGLVVTRDRFEWRPSENLLLVPLTSFLLAF